MLEYVKQQLLHCVNYPILLSLSGITVGKKKQTFGCAISEARKSVEMSQKELADKMQQAGLSMSPQYLNDIEHDRRNPSSDQIIKQFSKILDIQADWLYYLAGKLPADVREKQHLSMQDATECMVAFRRVAKDRRG